jgi:8-oxo-dGTP pyrophosphatase MutT (NUDIX family)
VGPFLLALNTGSARWRAGETVFFDDCLGGDMTGTGVPRWLEWAREIQSLGQTGLVYSDNDFDDQRYRRLVEIAAEIVHAKSGLDTGRLLEGFHEQTGYATPKVGVRGAVVHGGEILLVQERADGHWCMPGGWAEVGNHPSQVVVREVWEESGFDVTPRKVIGVYDANRGGQPLSFYHAYKIVFLCDLIGGEPRPSHETLDVRFFGFQDLPALSTNRTDRRHVNEVLAHLQDPSRPAAFD